MTDGDLPAIALRLGVATLVGIVLGFEREWNGHAAGVRTHALVALSAAMITVSALIMSEAVLARGADSDPVRVVQGLAQAIGFIAGGLIFVRGGDVHNMTTAAGLWLAAAIGIAAGAGQFVLVLAASGIALVVLVVLAPLKRLMPRHIRARDEPGGLSMPNRRGGAPDQDG